MWHNILLKWYSQDIKRICRYQLTQKNKITAINQLAVPVLTYGFGIIDWPQGEINKLDVKTRKTLTLHKVIYRNQCLDRIYLPRKEGGLGLTEINQVYRATVVSLGQYLKSAADTTMKTVKQHHTDTLSQQTSIVKLAENFGRDVLEEIEANKQTPATMIARKTRGSFCKKEQTERIERWQ